MDPTNLVQIAVAGVLVALYLKRRRNRVSRDG